MLSSTNKIRGGSRAAATLKIEHFVIIVSGFQPLTIITKPSILDVVVALDPHLKMIILSELFDLLTLSVVYDVSNCFWKTFISARNDFLNVRISSKKLSSDLEESLSFVFVLSVASFSFIISRWYFFIFFASTTNN